MLKKVFYFIVILFFLASCSGEKDKVLSSFDVYCEMVANDAKPIALHYPMGASEIDHYWSDFLSISQKHETQLYKEDRFPETLLFPSSMTEGKTIVVIYKQPRLKQYSQLKRDLKDLNSKDLSEQIALSRRFGRLLGYSPGGINDLLSKNTDLRGILIVGGDSISSQVRALSLSLP